MEINKLFGAMRKFDASDLHIKAGQPPVFRVSGQLSRMQNTPELTAEQSEALISPLLGEVQHAELERRGNADFAWADDELGRFRVNVFRQRGTLSAAVRKVNMHIPSFEELNLPEQIKRIPQIHQGLVLVGGVTGSGKSTTLAAILDTITKTRRCHILTIEDPIEYVFKDDKSIVNQRELGIDVSDFKEALRAAVRQDPDVMLIGEMRDAETFETALTAAETGHLVFGTVHSSGAAQTIGRILDLFPEDKHDAIRGSLAFNLRAVMNQKLLRGATKDASRVPVQEIMFDTPIIKKLLLDGEDHKIADAIKADSENGCESFNQALVRLNKAGLISKDEALKAAPNAEELRMALSGISISDGGGII